MGVTGDGHNNKGIAQQGCCIYSKEEHKQEKLQLPEASESQEDKFPHVGVVALAHDGTHFLPGLGWEKIC